MSGTLAEGEGFEPPTSFENILKTRKLLIFIGGIGRE
jgi:hypothetical protein